MNMPGFTAEASLYRTNGSYTAAPIAGSSSVSREQVVPAQFGKALPGPAGVVEAWPWICEKRLHGFLYSCLSMGGSPATCWAIAEYSYDICLQNPWGAYRY
jgi:hypothetical protein